jgi:hypothetical protein
MIVRMPDFERRCLSFFLDFKAEKFLSVPKMPKPEVWAFDPEV